MLTKIASITYKTLDSIDSIINKFPTICKLLQNITYLKCVTYIWLHVKCSWTSLFIIKFFIQLTEKENNSLIYLKSLLSIIFKNYKT